MVWFTCSHPCKTISHLVHINDKHPKCTIEIKYKTYPRSNLPNRSADSNRLPVALKRGMNTSALAFKTDFCRLCPVMLKYRIGRHVKVTNTFQFSFGLHACTLCGWRLASSSAYLSCLSSSIFGEQGPIQRNTHHEWAVMTCT